MSLSVAHPALQSELVHPSASTRIAHLFVGLTMGQKAISPTMALKKLIESGKGGGGDGIRTHDTGLTV